MEPQHLIRTLRRRWKPIVLLAAAGLILGATSSAMATDAGPAPVPVPRYQACHSLLVDSAGSTGELQWNVRNLAQLAQRLTQGDIPASVAASTGASTAELSARSWVVVRNDIQSLTVCDVGDARTDVEQVADSFATSLLAFLHDEAQAFQTSRLDNANKRITDAQECRDQAQSQIAGIQATNPLADVLALEQQAAACRLELNQANSDLISFKSDGTPSVPIDTLQAAQATQISEGAYKARRRAGAAGANVIVGVGDSVASATTSNSPSSRTPIPDGPVTRGALGFGGGLAVALGFVVFTERLDSRLRAKEDVESTLDLPVLAEIPPLGRSARKETNIICVEEPRSRSAEAFRALRSAIDYATIIEDARGNRTPGAHVVLLTSAGPGEGKTTTLANLAATMAEGDRTVLAINCDFRRPRLHRYLGGSTDARAVNVTDVAGVQLVTQVTLDDSDASPSDVVSAQRDLVERARSRFDVILLDTAPVLTTNDAADLLTVVDHVVMIVRSGHTSAEAAGRAVELLERRGKAPLGVALVGTRDVPSSADYYYEDGDPYLEPSRRRGRRRKDRSDQTLDDGPVTGVMAGS